MRLRLAGLALVTVALYSFLERPGGRVPGIIPQAPVFSNDTATQMLRQQPSCFVPNLGQWAHAAHYVARFGAMKMFLQDQGWTFTLREPSGTPAHRARTTQRAIPTAGAKAQRRVAISMTFQNAGEATLTPVHRLPGVHNYFLGDDPSKWRSEVPLYSAVRYRGIQPGVDVLARQQGGHFEFDLLLQPHAELDRVEIAVEGIEALHIDDEGRLILETALGPVRMAAPPSWQEGPSGSKTPIVCRYVLRGANRFGFEVPTRQPGWSLVVDPGLVWSTYLGGNSDDFPWTIVLDAHGAAIIAGDTMSNIFPTTTGAFDTTHNGAVDAFVTTLSPAGDQLVYSTFLGGSGWDRVSALAFDKKGRLTLAGSTASANFPTTAGAFDRSFNGSSGHGGDGFVARLSPSGSGLVYSTFLGGVHDDGVVGLAVDATGAATVAGVAISPDFPTTKGAFDTTHNGGWAGFVARLSASGSSLIYSTFLSGGQIDEIHTIALDPRGAATVAGWTSSPRFPISKGAFDSTFNKNHGKAFITRLSPSGASLVYSTFFGGSISALAVDARGDATIVGGVLVPGFPTTPGAFDTIYNGPSAFVCRLSASGSRLIYSTYLGAGGEIAGALALDSRGRATVAGITYSSDFPTTPGAFDTTHAGQGDGFVARLSPLGTRLIYSTLFGGAGTETVTGIAVDDQGIATVTGKTWSGDYPTTKGAFDRTLTGYYDGFVTRLELTPAFHAETLTLPRQTGGTQWLTVNAGKAHANRLYWIFGSVSGTTPGVKLLGLDIPLNPDSYTSFTISHPNSTVLNNSRGILDANGRATASFHVPANLPVPSGFTFHHAFVTYDANGGAYTASNSVPLRLQ